MQSKTALVLRRKYVNFVFIRPRAFSVLVQIAIASWLAHRGEMGDGLTKRQ